MVKHQLQPEAHTGPANIPRKEPPALRVFERSKRKFFATETSKSTEGKQELDHRLRRLAQIINTLVIGCKSQFCYIHALRFRPIIFCKNNFLPSFSANHMIFFSKLYV